MPALYRRIPTDVEAHQLCTPRDLHVGELWLRGHGLPTAQRHPALTDRGVLVPTGPPGTFTVARLGQWLTRDLTAGDWTVLDDDTFRLLHHSSDLTALIDATREAR